METQQPQPGSGANVQEVERRCRPQHAHGALGCLPPRRFRDLLINGLSGCSCELHSLPLSLFLCAPASRGRDRHLREQIENGMTQLTQSVEREQIENGMTQLTQSVERAYVVSSSG